LEPLLLKNPEIGVLPYGSGKLALDEEELIGILVTGKANRFLDVAASKLIIGYHRDADDFLDLNLLCLGKPPFLNTTMPFRDMCLDFISRLACRQANHLACKKMLDAEDGAKTLGDMAVVDNVRALFRTGLDNAGRLLLLMVEAGSGT
jgi:hypothetical protein